MATKSEQKPEKKGLSTEEKVELLIDLAIANGWSLPKGLKD